MRHLIQYSYRVSESFHKYIHNQITLSELIEKLRNIERYHRDAVQDGNPQNYLWFRFSTTDTLVTTISDLERDLHLIKNRDFTIERMREAISLNGELLIYYS